MDNFTKKTKLYGSDYREALIQVMHILVNCKLDTDDPLFVLISTLVTISVYSNDSRRTPRQCLQFYNCAFLHHELYVDLFKPGKASIYFYSLLVHGPVQHELVCSRSANAEAEERLFQQAGSAAKITDHKVDGFVKALLVRLQCKQLDASPVVNCYKSHLKVPELKRLHRHCHIIQIVILVSSLFRTTCLHFKATCRE